MKLKIDSEQQMIVIQDEGSERCLPLYSKEAFEAISAVWLKVGWSVKHPYTFSWLGRPIIQLPEDMVRVQEVIYSVKPDVIIETGVAHGGSLIFYAGLCQLIGKGRIIGVDIEIRSDNRAAIEAHELAPLIKLIEGDSTDEAIVSQVRALVEPSESVLVILDSNHTKNHVMAELEAYGQLVTSDSYIVATDGAMKDLHDAPRGEPGWAEDNPTAAAAEFAERHPEFKLEEPSWMFNESELDQRITFWPGAFLRRSRD